MPVTRPSRSVAAAVGALALIGITLERPAIRGDELSLPKAIERLEALLVLAPPRDLVSHAHHLAISQNADGWKVLVDGLRPPTRLTPFPHFYDAMDDLEELRVDNSERHEGQLAMALIAHVGANHELRIDGRRFTVADVVKGEMHRHEYRRWTSQILDGRIEQIVRDLTNRPSATDGSEAYRNRRERAALTELASMDLSWFIEAVAIHHAELGIRFDHTWHDGDSCSLNLPELIAAQVKFLELDEQRPFLAEHGLHGIAMLRGVGHLFKDAESVWQLANRHLRSREERLNAVSGRNDVIVLAHMLEITLCGPPGKGGTKTIQSADMLAARLAQAVLQAPSLEFAAVAHAIRALRLFEVRTQGVLRQKRAIPHRGCACV